MPAPRGISVCVQWAGIRAYESGVSPSREAANVASAFHSGIVTRPYNRLPLRGQHRNCTAGSITGKRAPVSRLTPPKTVGRGTRERAWILTDDNPGGPIRAPAWADLGLVTAHGPRIDVKAHSEKSVSS